MRTINYFIRYLLLLSLFPISIQFLYSQNAKEILDISYKKCMEIKSGSYDISYVIKQNYPTYIYDTVGYVKVDFLKFDNDSLWRYKFRYFNTIQNTGVWYTGEEIIRLIRDS